MQRWRLLFLLVAALAHGGSPQFCRAIEIVRIEEYWQLRIGQPDPQSVAPQASMVMAPYSQLDATYFVFALNHRGVPHFAPGGLQVQHWENDAPIATIDARSEQPIVDANEVIAWVQRLELKEGRLVFEVVDGQSNSWGAFGGGQELQLTVPTTLTNLNGYAPRISLEESGVSFGGNRVQSLVLQKLRWTDSAGQVYELVAPIDVDADLDP
jgi:hypothetical protein